MQKARTLSEEEAIAKILQVIAAKHARRAAANPPDMNDPSSVVRWLEDAARAAEEEFDRFMGVVPEPGTGRRRMIDAMSGTRVLVMPRADGD